MSLKHLLPNALSLVTSTDVLFAPKSIYKIPALYKTELFRILTILFLLTPHKTPLRPAPFTLNTEKIHLPRHLLQIFGLKKQSRSLKY